MPKIFSEHLETHNTFDFEWHGIAAYEKMLALNPVFCVCQNGLSELLTMIMLQNTDAKAFWGFVRLFFRNSKGIVYEIENHCAHDCISSVPKIWNAINPGRFTIAEIQNASCHLDIVLFPLINLPVAKI